MKNSKFFSFVILLIIGIFLGFYFQNSVLNGTFENRIGKNLVDSYFAEEHSIYKKDIFGYSLTHSPYKENYAKTKSISTLSIYEFQELLVETAPVVEPQLSHPCQFYSALWGYFLDSKGIPHKYIVIPGHIFVIAYVSDGYYLLDETRVVKTSYAK